MEFIDSFGQLRRIIEVLGGYLGIVTADQAVSVVLRPNGLRRGIERVTVIGSLLFRCGLCLGGDCGLDWRRDGLFLLLVLSLIFIDLYSASLDCKSSLCGLVGVERALIVSLLFCLTTHPFFSLIGNLLHLVDHLLLGTI